MATILCVGPGPHIGDGTLGDGLAGTIACCGAAPCVAAAMALPQAVEADAIAAKIQNAKATVNQMSAQLPGFSQQIAADQTAVANWSTLAAADQAAIMGRVISGFGTAMQATVEHAIATGVLPPPTAVALSGAGTLTAS